MKWEYMTIDLASIGTRASEIGVLNAAGAQGWELLQILPPYKALMKRPVVEGARAASHSSAPAMRPPEAHSLVAAGSSSSPAPAVTMPPGASVAPKYRNPATGETWSGRGRMASWLAAKVQAGESIESYLISPE